MGLFGRALGVVWKRCPPGLVALVARGGCSASQGVPVLGGSQAWDWGNWRANHHLAAGLLPAVAGGSSCCPGSGWGLEPSLPGKDSLGWGGKGGSGQKGICMVCTELLPETPASSRDPTMGLSPLSDATQRFNY